MTHPTPGENPPNRRWHAVPKMIGKRGDRVGEGSPLGLEDLPEHLDVIWLERGSGHAAAAFEVEHTTSIHSGIMRMLDLATGAAQTVRGLYLVAPDSREADVRKQLARPAFRRIGDLSVKFLPYSELERNRQSMARFGEGLKAVDAVARALV